ncbi:MAG: GNAT family N-acetyltransferase [Candidatus Gastranaerophilales bacterium]|nr:GNAT family N-acetyltransferase [Candidatus Gastranaerophilales bacterium]
MIRRSLTSDVDQLSAIETQLFEYDILSKSNFKYLITKANAQMLVFVENKKIIGYAVLLFRKNSQKARLYSIAVLSNYQGKNVGTMLLEELENYAVKKAVKEIYLEVRIDDKKAKSFYAKLNYEIFGKYKNYYNNSIDAFRMKKTLGDFKTK